jgi:hypothetical protein
MLAKAAAYCGRELSSRDRIVADGFVDTDPFNADLAAVRAEPPFEQLRANARVMMIARRPTRRLPSSIPDSLLASSASDPTRSVAIGRGP